MTNAQRIHAEVALVALTVAALAVVDWVLLPARASSWMIAIGTALGMWLVITLIGRARSFNDYSPAERNFLMASIAGGGLLLAASLLRHAANALGFSGGEPLDRALGVGGGLLLLLLGNTMPKILSPLTAKRCVPAQVQSLQRFAGWAFVLAGTVVIVLSLILPLDVARNWSMIATASTLVIVVLRYVWAFLALSARSSPTSG
jgi:hypothetical protein